MSELEPLPFKDGETMPLHEFERRLASFYRGGVTPKQLRHSVTVQVRKGKMSLKFGTTPKGQKSGRPDF